MNFSCVLRLFFEGNRNIFKQAFDIINQKMKKLFEFEQKRLKYQYTDILYGCQTLKYNFLNMFGNIDANSIGHGYRKY